MRQIILDTETTGREHHLGHRVIEIGCLELINRKITGNFYHQYINPERDSEAGALAVHGLTQEFLMDHPLFAEIAAPFLEFIKGAQLIIHNAPFDIGFLDSELARHKKAHRKITDHCSVLDTLVLARQMHPGQRNSLDALCKRYNVNNSHRELHGALLDAELLAKVYLAMTGGQTSLLREEQSTDQQTKAVQAISQANFIHKKIAVIKATSEELNAHQDRLNAIAKQSKKGCVWLKQTETIT